MCSSDLQYGWIISAFSVAYMVGNPVWGRILDRVGVRRGMTGAVSLWTIASTAHVAATGFWSFAAFRAVLGFGEGATFPGGLRTVVQTLPAELRSRGTALAYSGGSLGALITPLVVTPVAAMWGWRGAFWATGAVGTLWVLWWTLLGRRESLATTEPSHSSGLSMAWDDTNVWALVAAYSLGGLPIGFVLYQASLYLSAVLHQSQTQIGKVLWVPPERSKSRRPRPVALSYARNQAPLSPLALVMSPASPEMTREEVVTIPILPARPVRGMLSPFNAG